jgi:hypothetical protein
LAQRKEIEEGRHFLLQQAGNTADRMESKNLQRYSSGG